MAGFDWDSTHTYALGDLASYAGIPYISLQNTNLNHEPDVSPTWWGGAVAASDLVGYAALLPEMQASKLVGYAPLLPEMQASDLVGYAPLLPQLQASDLVAYAVLLPAARNRPYIFKASFP